MLSRIIPIIAYTAAAIFLAYALAAALIPLT